MPNIRISEEYKRYEHSSIMKKIAQDAHEEHYCGQTSSATFDELCKVLNQQLIEAGTKFLDAGCGNGCFSLKIAKKYNVYVDGIDLSEDVIRVATYQSTNQKLDNLCKFHIGDFSEINEDAIYNSILSIGSLYWNQDLEKTFNIWNRLLLKNGGLIIFSNLENETLSTKEQESIGHTKFIPITNIQKVATQSGFKNEVIYDGTEKYCLWLNKWCDSINMNLTQVIDEMGIDKTKQFVERFKTYLKLANSRKVLRMILVYRKVA